MQNELESRTRAVCVQRARVALVVLFSLTGICESIASPAVPDRNALIALARSERAAGHRMEALAYCQEVLARWPNDSSARQLNVQLLTEMGASVRALELTSVGAPTESKARDRLLADRAAHEIRWANGEPANAQHPYAEADQAIADIERLAADPREPPVIRQQARIDALVALDRGDRAGQVLTAYAVLENEHVQLPPYAERAVADAMLQQHRPREAVALYEDSIRRDPGPYDLSDTDPRIGLTYAYIESGQTQKAFATIDALAAKEPPWIHLTGVRGGVQNPRKVDADINAATLREYVGMPSDAYARLWKLTTEAPANAQLRRELAMAELARGWPRRAQDTLHIADTLDERDVSAELDEAETLRALNDYVGVQENLDQAEQQGGRSGRVEDAVQAWDRERGWQFDIAHDNGHGNSPDYGDHDQETLATLASPLIDDHWRVLALARLASAGLPEGNVSRDRFGLGLQGYARDLEYYIQALVATDHFVRRTAFEAGLHWSISDHWTVSADWSSAGVDVPLRAQYYGISAKTLDTAVQWRASELTSARLAVYQDRFSDGNLRNGWLANVIQRLYTAPNLSLDGGVEIGGSRNSEIDRPYFNPAQDHSYALTGTLQNLLSQYANRNWTQRIDLAVGRYAELGYATGWMASARYGQTFKPQNGLSFGWGLALHNQPYDGRHETRLVFDVTMHWGE